MHKNTLPIKPNECNSLLVYQNKFYKELSEMVKEENLPMFDINYLPSIKKIFKNFFSSKDYFVNTISFTDPNSLLEECMVQITKNNNSENMDGNTIIIYGDEDKMYDIFYLEDLITKRTDEEIQEQDNLNEFGSICNIDLEPIYKDCAIFKTIYENGFYMNSEITEEDLLEITLNNFYHKGVLLLENEIEEIIFPGEIPIINEYKLVKMDVINIFGLFLLPWEIQEEIKDECIEYLIENHNASIIFNKKITSKIFLTILSPGNQKKIWNLSKKILVNIIDLLENEEKCRQLGKDIEANVKVTNPFFLIKKYC